MHEGGGVKALETPVAPNCQGKLRSDPGQRDGNSFCTASVAQRQSAGLGIENRVRNTLVPGACTGAATAVQAVVSSIVWAFRRLKKPMCREISARGYALYVCPPFSFCPVPLTLEPHRKYHDSLCARVLAASPP